MSPTIADKFELLLSNPDAQLIDADKGIWLISGEEMKTNAAYKFFTTSHSNGTTTDDRQERKTAIRVDAKVASITGAIARWMSNDGNSKIVWGDNEVSISRLRSAVITAFKTQTGLDVEPKMISNYVNTMKRAGEIVMTKRGYFRATNESKIDYSIFFA